MNIEEINRIALLKGVEPEGKPKWEIIRLIQMAEGFEPCYGTKKFTCEYMHCLWWEDCQGMFHRIEVI